MNLHRFPVLCFFALAATGATAADSPSDPFLWLEEVRGDKAMAWVREQNAAAKHRVEEAPGFGSTRDRLLAILNSRDRIPGVVKRGDHLYNFWRDAEHVRGLWRRTTLAVYRKPDPAWETVLDLDALATSEKENWVWKGSDWLEPSNERVLISLSRGGGDAVVIREFDPARKAFVPDGFVVPEAKSDLTWRDRDSVYVGTDFGPGTMTTSGYPRVVKAWRRGQPMSAATTVYEGKETDVEVSATAESERDFHREFLVRSVTFYTSEVSLRVGEKFVALDIPEDARFDSFREHLFLTLRSEWKLPGKTYPQGALLAIAWDKFLAGNRDFAVLFVPGPRTSLAGVSHTRHHTVVNELDNVHNRLFVHTPQSDGTWTRRALEVEGLGTLDFSALDPETDEYLLMVADFVTPTTLSYGTLAEGGRERLKSLPAFFNAANLAITQHEATSRDGTKVPYFQVARKDLKLDGTNPTLLYGYGGFRQAMLPSYSAGVGVGWLEKGGVYILANIRGGAEFGPAWHQAALKANRQRAYDDFIAIAEDLIARKVTSTSHLGIKGGSNGGLLMGVMLTQRPDLFGAVVCQAPLLDMRRYNHLLAGASWMGEYGDPDKPEEWAFIQKYSPYQNVRAGTKYPPILFTTSTADDRVHPGHARKMAALMESQHHDVIFYENTEGGHAGSANNVQQAYMDALAYTFLWQHLR